MTPSYNFHKKQIVFFCATTLYVSIYKIANEFKKKGYEIVLITISEKGKTDLTMYNQLFDKVIISNFQIHKPTFKNIFKMSKRLPDLLKSIYHMKKLRPYAVFSVAPPNYISALAIRFFKKYPIVYFPSDIFSHFHKDKNEALKSGVKEFDIRAEKFCFENCGGVIHKGSPKEIDYIAENGILAGKVKIPKYSLSFPPYCSNEFMIPINRNKFSKIDNEIHLAYAGSSWGGKGSVIFLNKFLKTLLDQKIHIHFYAKTQHLSKEEEKIYYEKNFPEILKHPYFHLTFEIDPKKELISELSKADFGFMIEKSKEEKIGVLEHKYLSGNKIAAYLEAGIPFLYSSDFEFVEEIMKRYDLNLSVDMYDFQKLNELNKRLQKINYKKIIENLEKARKEFNIETRFPELEEFVQKVVKEHKIKNGTI